MCKIKRNEFALCRQCKSSLKNTGSTPPRTILDELIPIYGIEIIKLVLAATILRNDTVASAQYSENIKKWAERFDKRIGFMKDSIGLSKASSGKITQLVYLLQKIKS